MRQIVTMVENTLGEFGLLEYYPSLFAPLYGNLHRIHFVRRVRFFVEYLHSAKYSVYYLTVNGVIVGYCVVAPGGRRLKCTSKDDIVLGPYYILKEHRGKGYSKILLRLVLEYCSYPYKAAYDFIHENNKASIGCSRAVGFEPFGRLYVSRLLRRLVITDQGDNIIFKYVKPVK